MEGCPSHLLADFEGQLLEARGRQSLVLGQRRDQLRPGRRHLLQHGHHPRQVLPALQQRVRHLAGKNGMRGNGCGLPESTRAPGSSLGLGGITGRWRGNRSWVGIQEFT